MTFEEYLLKKRIDSTQFKENAPEQYEEFASLFAQVHPNSFTFQKLNLINFIRRKFPVKEEVIPESSKKSEIAKELPKLENEDTKQDTVAKEPIRAISKPLFKRKS